MATRAKRQTEVKPLNGDVFPASEGPALQFVALDAIDVRVQARTEFDEATIVELAADVKANGMLQPVLLRPVDDRFLLIAGERRFRAARLAGLTAVPALVGAVSDEQAEDMQLAENIQREDLSLSDVAAAVRRLFDRLGKLDAVAHRVNKSKAWVSKRLAMTYQEFDWRARQLLADGVTEDLELLQCVCKVGALDHLASADLDVDIRAGKAGRKEARALLAKLKKEFAERVVVADVSEPTKKRSGKALPTAPVFNATHALWHLVGEFRGENCRPVFEMVDGFDAEQQEAMLASLRADYNQGTEVAGGNPLHIVRRLGALSATHSLEEPSIAAFTLGAFGMPFELGTVLSELQLAINFCFACETVSGD